MNHEISKSGLLDLDGGAAYLELSPAGQMSDAKRALALLSALPPGKMLLGKFPAAHDAKLYRKRHRIENLFTQSKD